MGPSDLRESINRAIGEELAAVEWNESEWTLGESLDSLQFVILLDELSDWLGFDVPHHELVDDNFRSPSSIVAMVERLEGERA